MDEGPHLGYAIQWFTFALIALVGAGVAVRADRRGSHRAMSTGDNLRGAVQSTETRHG
jgi:cytochrome oxidase assembly protein ShyY1